MNVVMLITLIIIISLIVLVSLVLLMSLVLLVSLVLLMSLVLLVRLVIFDTFDTGPHNLSVISRDLQNSTMFIHLLRHLKIMVKIKI